MNEIISGRYSGCFLNSVGGDVSVMFGFSKKANISSENVKSIELITEEQKKSLSSAVIRGTVGAALLGLPGLAAGILTTKNKNKLLVCISYLDSDEVSFAEVDTKMYQQLKMAATRLSNETIRKNQEEAYFLQRKEYFLNKQKNANAESLETITPSQSISASEQSSSVQYMDSQEKNNVTGEENIESDTPNSNNEVVKEESVILEEIKPVEEPKETTEVIEDSSLQNEEPQKFNGGGCLRWVICGLFVFGSFGGFIGGNFGAVFLLLLGLIFSPPVNRILYEKLGGKKTVVQIVLAIIAMVLFGVTSPKKDTDKKEDASQTKSSEQSKRLNHLKVERQ